MKILPDIELVDLALKYKNAIIIGDLHLGYEESLLKQGYLAPFLQLKKIMGRLGKIIQKAKPEKIIINGDIKEEFGSITRQEWGETLKLIDSLGNKAELILIKGNHDTILEPIARKRNIKVKERFDIDDITIVHGDKLVKNPNRTIIISHEHPAISFKERPDEKYKCFLLGKYKSKNLIVLPSFNPLLPGSDITTGGFLSPYLKNIKNFEVFVVQDKVYKFGKLKNLL